MTPPGVVNPRMEAHEYDEEQARGALARIVLTPEQARQRRAEIDAAKRLADMQRSVAEAMDKLVSGEASVNVGPLPADIAELAAGVFRAKGWTATVADACGFRIGSSFVDVSAPTPRGSR